MHFHFRSTELSVWLFNMLPQYQMANIFNYSEAIDLLNKSTYSNAPQSHNFVSFHVRKRSFVLSVQAITFVIDEKTSCPP